MDQGARSHVETLLDEGVKLLFDEDATAEQRVDGFRGLFREYFAVRSIGRWTLGRHWRKATPAQRQEFLRRFEDLIVLGQIKRFGNYTGGRVDVIKAELNNANTATVFSLVVPAQGDAPIPVNWRVGHKNGIYRITDVIIHGTSMSQTLRSDFGATIRRNGNSIAVFLEVIGEKVAVLEEELKTRDGVTPGHLARANRN